MGITTTTTTTCDLCGNSHKSLPLEPQLDRSDKPNGWVVIQVADLHLDRCFNRKDVCSGCVKRIAAAAAKTAVK